MAIRFPDAAPMGNRAGRAGRAGLSGPVRATVADQPVSTPLPWTARIGWVDVGNALGQAHAGRSMWLSA